MQTFRVCDSQESHFFLGINRECCCWATWEKVTVTQGLFYYADLFRQPREKSKKMWRGELSRGGSAVAKAAIQEHRFKPVHRAMLFEPFYLFSEPVR